MTIHNNISEIKAEMLLNYLYPELEEKWVARCEGTFYRNYNSDTMYLNVTDKEVSLSRDGFLRLLPQGLLTSDEELKNGDVAENYEALKRRQHRLLEAFLPFDTYFFRKKLNLERQTSQILEGKLSFILKEYFDYDIEKEESPLVREAAGLLPYVSTWRGDFGFLCNVIADLMGCEVNMTIGRYSHLDTTICWLPKIKYELLISGLTPEQYRQKNDELQPLHSFLTEWFIPFDVVCEMVIKEHPAAGLPVSRPALGYNTEIKQAN